jgi:hypothetical protein
MQAHTYILCGLCDLCVRRLFSALGGPRSTYITTRDTYDSGRTLIQTSADKQTTRLQGTHKHRQPKHKYNRKQKAVHEISHKQIWKERIGLFCVRGKCNRRCKATHKTDRIVLYMQVHESPSTIWHTQPWPHTLCFRHACFACTSSTKHPVQVNHLLLPGSARATELGTQHAQDPETAVGKEASLGALKWATTNRSV